MEKSVNKYPEGKTVTVYYDPDRPEVAVLEAGVSRQAYFPLIFGSFFIVVNIVMLIGGVLRRLIPEH